MANAMEGLIQTTKWTIMLLMMGIRKQGLLAKGCMAVAMGLVTTLYQRSQ